MELSARVLLIYACVGDVVQQTQCNTVDTTVLIIDDDDDDR